MAETPEYLYSVRMRAAGSDGRHVSGAERIVSEAEVPQVSSELLARALDRGGVAEAHVSVDRRERSQVYAIPCLPVTTVPLPEWEEWLHVLGGLFEDARIGRPAIEAALEGLFSGFLPGGAVTRGAVILDACTGARLDTDPERGVRARHFDYSREGRVAARQALGDAGLAHFRTFEALALASKVTWAGVALELCWSDDPDYRPGYIATPTHGYVRIPEFKPPGTVGGRVFFVHPEADLAGILRRLEQEWTLVQPPVRVRTLDAASFCEELRLSSNE